MTFLQIKHNKTSASKQARLRNNFNTSCYLPLQDHVSLPLKPKHLESSWISTFKHPSSLCQNCASEVQQSAASRVALWVRSVGFPDPADRSTKAWKIRPPCCEAKNPWLWSLVKKSKSGKTETEWHRKWCKTEWSVTTARLEQRMEDERRIIGSLLGSICINQKTIHTYSTY